jgi:hypothetical protein
MAPPAASVIRLGATWKFGQGVRQELFRGSRSRCAQLYNVGHLRRVMKCIFSLRYIAADEQVELEFRRELTSATVFGRFQLG